MEISELNYRLSSIFCENIELYELLDQDAKKWYERSYKSYPERDFKESFVYGVKIDDLIQFNFSVKKFDNLMKSFYTNYINKYLAKQLIIAENGLLERRGVEKSKELIRMNLKGERLHKFLSYSTNYGIGVWVYFVPQKLVDEIKNKIEIVLNKKLIEFENEYSDACWVFRYKFTGNYLDHNLIVEQI